MPIDHWPDQELVCYSTPPQGTSNNWWVLLIFVLCLERYRGNSINLRNSWCLQRLMMMMMMTTNDHGDDAADDNNDDPDTVNVLKLGGLHEMREQCVILDHVLGPRGVNLPILANCLSQQFAKKECLVGLERFSMRSVEKERCLEIGLRGKQNVQVKTDSLTSYQKTCTSIFWKRQNYSSIIQDYWKLERHTKANPSELPNWDIWATQLHKAIMLASRKLQLHILIIPGMICKCLHKFGDGIDTNGIPGCPSIKEIYAPDKGSASRGQQLTSNLVHMMFLEDISQANSRPKPEQEFVHLLI